MQIKPIKTPVCVTEASGVARKGNELLIVSDAAPGAYYTFDVSGERGRVRCNDRAPVYSRSFV